MRKINIHQAKTHLSRLIDEAAAGEPFIIARAGKPVVRVVALDMPAPEPRRLIGVLEGRMTFPDDRAAFKAMGKDEIDLMLGSDDGSGFCSIRIFSFG